jgi:hypothetical protein
VKRNSIYRTEKLNFDAVRNAFHVLPRECLDLFEYARFATGQLWENYLFKLNKLLRVPNNVSISLNKGNNIQGFLVLEYLPYDSGIFEFGAYRITDLCISGNDRVENGFIIDYLLEELASVASRNSIKYITIPLNACKPNSDLIFTKLMRSGFYFINSLLTFKMAKDDFKRLTLYISRHPNVKIRHAREEDRDALCEIARESYKIDRYHLDENLDKDKCDLLCERSAENSLLHGYANIVIVAEYNNHVVGYKSAKKDFNSSLDVTLGRSLASAVSAKARGLGIYSLMNNSMLKWFYENTDLAEMGTYATNIPVVKTWNTNGLNVIRVTYQLAKFF